MSKSSPLQVAVGFEGSEAITILRGQLDGYRLARDLEYPIHVHEGRGTPLRYGFAAVDELFSATFRHAEEVRSERGADMGLGIAYGLLYIPTSDSRLRHPLAFETIMLSLVDANGPVCWAIPEEACPKDAECLYAISRRLFRVANRVRAKAVSDATADFVKYFMPLMLNHLRPLPQGFGVLRELH